MLLKQETLHRSTGIAAHFVSISKSKFSAVLYSLLGLVVHTCRFMVSVLGKLYADKINFLL